MDMRRRIPRHLADVDHRHDPRLGQPEFLARPAVGEGEDHVGDVLDRGVVGDDEQVVVVHVGDIDLVEAPVPPHLARAALLEGGGGRGQVRIGLAGAGGVGGDAPRGGLGRSAEIDPGGVGDEVPGHARIDDEALVQLVELAGAVIDGVVDLDIVLGSEIGLQRVEVGDLPDLAKQRAGAEMGHTEGCRQPAANRGFPGAEIAAECNPHGCRNRWLLMGR